MKKFQSRTLGQSVFAVAMMLAIASWAQAGLVQTMFNDLSSGSVSGQAVGGTGLTGTWGGGSNIQVIAGDLAAPASTNFNLPQSGTAQSVRGDVATTTGSSIEAEIATPLTGEVWFSFLVNPVAGARSGIDINPADNPASPSGSPLRIITVNDELRLITPSDNQNAGSVAYSQTALVLGRIQINGNGANEVVSIWLNPDVTNHGAADYIMNDADFVTTDIFRLGIESYRSGGTVGGIVDLVTLSNGFGAYENVTGVPTPSALSAGLILLNLLVMRRK